MKIAVVGGGMTGLAAAYYLSQKGHQITLFEKESYLGGLAACFKEGENYLEYFVHHFFRSDDEALYLIKLLGLADKLFWHRSGAPIFWQGKVYPFTTPIDLLRFSPLKFLNRLRCGLAALYLKSTKNFHHFENWTAVDWLKKHMGEEVFQVIWQPLLSKKFGRLYPQVSMTWLWARVFYRSTYLGYLKEGGLQLLVDRLSSAIKEKGGQIRLNSEVKDLKPLLSSYDKVIFTAATPVFLHAGRRLLPSAFLKRLSKVHYLGAVSLVLRLKHSLLPGVYWLNINDSRLPFVVAVEHTNLLPPEHYAGYHLVYLEGYLPTDHPLFQKKPPQLFKVWTRNLHLLNPRFQPNWVAGYQLFKAPFAQPVMFKGYHRFIPPLKTPVKNLYLANLSQIYPQDRGVNYSLRLGRKVAELITTPAKR